MLTPVTLDLLSGDITTEILDLRRRILLNPNATDDDLKKIAYESDPFINAGMQGFEVLDLLSKKLRAGWVNRGIHRTLIESVWEHSLNVERAVNCFAIGFPDQISDTTHQSARYHDILEFHPVLPDITPRCSYSSADKLLLERYVMIVLEILFNGKYDEILKMIQEYTLGRNKDQGLIYILDKIDAGIKALDYGRLGYADVVDDFHPRILEQLDASPDLKSIYQIMLEREFSHWPSHFQYFLLLELSGDYNEWQRKILETI